MGIKIAKLNCYSLFFFFFAIHCLNKFYASVSSHEVLTFLEEYIIHNNDGNDFEHMKVYYKFSVHSTH